MCSPPPQAGHDEHFTNYRDTTPNRYTEPGRHIVTPTDAPLAWRSCAIVRVPLRSPLRRLTTTAARAVAGAAPNSGALGALPAPEAGDPQ